MKNTSTEANRAPTTSAGTTFFRIAALLLVLFAFMLSLEMMMDAFRLLGETIVRQIIRATANPFISLFIGLLATAIVQSSSVTTSMIVAIVASGTLSLESAVPMVMGANIGTTITSTIVSLAHITNKKEFRKAFAVATMHDFFNILVTIILFPLEYYFGVLSRLSHQVAGWIAPVRNESSTFVQLTIQPVSSAIMQWLGQNAYVLLALSVALLLGSIKYLSSLLRAMLIGESQRKVDKWMFGTPSTALFWGLFLTGTIQSSSVTTSLVVPVVATNKISAKKAFPFILGANIGTTLTALIAAIARSETAVSIAMAHVLFNVIGVLIFFPIPAIRNIPVQLARKMGRLTIRYRAIGFVYIFVVFFLIPFLLIYLTTGKPSQNTPVDARQSVPEKSLETQEP